MVLKIPQVLKPEEVTRARKKLEKAKWIDGRTTAGYQAAKAKTNLQLQLDDPVARELGDLIIRSLQQTPLFMSAALPLRIFPPLFNRYENGHSFGTHVDGAIRAVPGMPIRIRTDLSATLFFSNPGDYDGGELVIEDTYGTHQVKLQAGDLILYPASSLHHVKPITRGVRLASFFWIQSMVRGDEDRTLLFDLDTVVQNLARELPDNPAGVQLTNIYHNLVRRWAEL
jgi:PKHD-type hydroxylase